MTKGRWRALAGVPLAVLGLWAAFPAQAQDVPGLDCELLSYRMLSSQELGLQQRVTHVGLPVVSCADGSSIRSDTATVYSVTNLGIFDGNVHYETPEWSLESDHLTYVEPEGRLTAIGGVVLVNREDGSVVRGDTLVRVEGVAPDQDRMTVTGGRPSATLPPGERAVTPEAPEVPEEGDGAPYEVVGDRLVFEGDGGFRAYGTVQVTRLELNAAGDSLHYHQGQGTLVLRGSARMEGEDYHLTAETLELDLPDDRLTEIRARQDGELTTTELTLTAPALIRILLDEERMERLVALRRLAPEEDEEDPDAPPPDPGDAGAVEDEVEEPAQPRAVTPDFILTGDSLDVLAPQEVLETVTAVGRARGETRNRVLPGDVEEEYPELARKDWIEGDEIVAAFEPVSEVTEEDDPEPAVAGEARAYRLESLVARGNARSLYRIEVEEEEEAEPEADPPPEDEEPDALSPEEAFPERRWAISYLLADEIRIVMEAGEVERMEAEGDVRGIHLEPQRRRTASQEAGEGGMAGGGGPRPLPGPQEGVGW